MKNHLKYSILITLILVIATGLMLEQTRAIGYEPQRSPYESNPLNKGWFGVGVPATPGDMQDGSLDTAGSFLLGSTPVISRPDNDGFYTAWTRDYLSWNDWPTYADPYVYATAANQFETSTLEDTYDPPTESTISSVTVKAYARRFGTTPNGRFSLMFRLDSTDSVSATINSPTTTGWTLYTYSLTSPPGGTTWDWSQVNALEAGAKSIGPTSGSWAGQLGITQLWVEVTATYSSAHYELSYFTNTPSDPFAIGFVDLKMKYNVPTALADDTYKIEYTTGTTWNTLQSSTSNVYDDDGGAAIRPWSHILPEDGTWNWEDLANLRVRVTATQVGGAWDGQKMFIYEIWASVYPIWDVPPTGSAHMAVIPSKVYRVNAFDMIFVDVYVTGATEMRGFRLLLTFNINVVTADSFFIYDPFQYVTVTPELNNTRGWVYLQQSSSTAQPGFTGQEPVARVYFTIAEAGGTSELNVIDQADFDARTDWPFGMGPSKLKDIYAADIPTTMHDGWVSTIRRFLSYPNGILPPGDPTLPPNNVWHEEYPTFSEIWKLTSWEDTQKSDEPGYGVLSESDQIDMVNSTGWKHWFHVDQVTITIHFTYKGTDTGIGKAEPSSPTTEPLVPGIGSTWHMIYPDYCRTFTITNHEDTDTDGYIDPSEQFAFTFDDDPEVILHWAHLDTVTTDIIISQKPIPPEPTVPEFPLGIGVLMSLVALIPVIYVWRTRPQKKVLKR